MAGSVIVNGSRTPIGKLSGALRDRSATELGAVAIAGALEKAGLRPDFVDAVIMGHVLQAGQGQLSARQAALGAGIPRSVPATTVNKVCLSGLAAIFLADQLIATGEADVVVAGGMESMTQAPYLLPRARRGYALGDGTLVDSMMFDGLTCAIDKESMGLATDRYNDNRISRTRQDEFAARSHQLAAAADQSLRFAQEITPVELESRGTYTVINHDEGIRPESTPEGLAKLRPAFAASGSITAGNASQISDGAAAVVVMSRRKAAELGLDVLGEFVAYGQVAGPSPSLLNQPADAINAALKKADLSVGDIDLFEINEAFAAVALSAIDALQIDADRCNVNGGAIALGHPIGMSGARLALTALYEIRQRGARTAAIGICGGGGQGDALIVRSIVS